MTRPEARNTAAEESAVLRRRAGAGIICAPLRVEAEALRRGLRGHSDAVEVIRTGYGAARSATAAARIAESDAPMMAVGGVGGGLTDDLHVGDIVVATQVCESGAGEGRAVCCPSAPLLAGELRRAGLTVRLGPMATVSKLAGASAHADLAAAGVIAVDMESAQLLGGAAGRPAVVVRAISDTPAHPLVSPHTVTGGLAALRSLRLAAPALARWAAAVGPRQVLLASPRSFCAGVERAIEIVELTLDRHGPPVYVRKQIVHNTAVVASLEQLGAIFVDELDRGARRRHRRVLRARRRPGASGTRRPGAGLTPWTPPARWSPRCTPRRAGSPATATWSR